MSRAKTFLLQLWQDERGLWAVLKDDSSGRLHQFESLEALTLFLTRGDPAPPPAPQGPDLPAPALAFKA